MTTLRCTQKLAKRLKCELSDVTTSPSEALLPEWTCNLVRFGRLQQIVCVNHQTRLPIFLTAAPADTFPERFQARLGEMLIALGINHEAVSAELVHHSTPTFCKTNDRSVLGTLNDFVQMATYRVDSNDTDYLLTVSLAMAHTPCSPIGYDCPDRLTRSLFLAA